EPPAPTARPTPPQRPVSPPPRQAPARPRRETTVSEMSTVSDLPPDLLGVLPEHRQAAGGQYARVTELLRDGGDVTYAEQLLLSCCKLDPANFLYRKMLREVVRDNGGKRGGGWFGALTHMSARSRLKAATKAGEHKKVLEDGEELLIKLPGD